MAKKQILILHGWGSSKKSWSAVKEKLESNGFEVIVPDIPGFGENPAPDKPWNSDNYISWLLEFLKGHQIQIPISIVGHSFGGGLAMKLAILHPELIDKLVLVGAARAGEKRTVKKKAIRIIAKVGRAIAFIPFFDLVRKGFYKYIVGARDYEKANGNMKETMKLIIKEDLSNDIEKIAIPTLLIWGSKDRATPLEDGKFINRKIRGSKLEILDGLGHAINLESPARLAEMIYNFVK